jgi:hypothetical protein
MQHAQHPKLLRAWFVFLQNQFLQYLLADGIAFNFETGS